MKKCEFCGKEISYFDQYCNNNCESSTKAFYKKRNRRAKLSSTLTVIALAGFGISAFMFLFGIKWASMMISACITLFGILLIIFPYATDYMIKKYTVKKSVVIMKRAGIVILALGIAFIFASVMYIFA